MNQEALIDTQADKDANTEASSYGQRLRKAREALGYSVDEVAIELHLARDVIIHIEQEAEGSLPNPIFVRGYLRAYAKLVNVDAEQVIAAFNKVCAPEEHKKLTPSRQIVIRPMKAGGEKPVRWVTYIIFIGLIALVLMWWHSHNSDTSSSDNGTMAALATLKPVSDNANTSSLSTAAVTSNAANQASTATNAGASSQVTSGASQVVSSYSPNNVVDTNVQNLAPNANAPAAGSNTITTPTSQSTTTPTTTSSNTQATTQTAAAQPGQTLTTTPVPVVNAPQTSTTDNNSAGTGVKQPSTKPKSTASAWRNPDLQ